MSIIWGLIAVFLLIVEFMTIKIVYIWFSASALISLILSLFNDIFFLQFILFIILGTVFNIYFRDKLVEFLKLKAIITDADKIIGKEAIVTKEIKENCYGEVTVSKKKWAAYSEEHLVKGVKATVEAIEGVRLKVRKK
ncbi:MAG: NfeD family protein [Bacilli bacterium]